MEEKSEKWDETSFMQMRGIGKKRENSGIINVWKWYNNRNKKGSFEIIRASRIVEKPSPQI